MSPRIVLTFAAASTALLTTACGGDRERTAESVVAAFYPLAYAAQQVAPEADVANLTPAGAEPHDLELTPRDVERLRAADRVFYVGGGFMPALENVVGDSDNAVDVLVGLELLQAEATIDPHVWLDPLRYAQVAARMAEELGRPEAAQALVDRLEALDEEIRAGLASCERREIVTSHAAYGYLADAYDLEQIALTGVSPEAEPSPRAIEELVAEVEATGATTVFFETLVAPDLAETVAREAGARTAALNPLEGLTEDELEAGADYFAVMHENLAVLRTALACR